MDEFSTDYLAHYGVLGMKWGVRHDPKKAYQKASKNLIRLKRNQTRLLKKLLNLDAMQKQIDLVN